MQDKPTNTTLASMTIFVFLSCGTSRHYLKQNWRVALALAAKRCGNGVKKWDYCVISHK